MGAYINLKTHATLRLEPILLIVERTWNKRGDESKYRHIASSGYSRCYSGGDKKEKKREMETGRKREIKKVMKRERER